MNQNQYPIKISPLTPAALESLHGRGDSVLFWQGKFYDENWANCSFYHCRFEDIDFIKNLIQGMSFFGCVLKNCSFESSALSGVQFNCGILEEVNFNNTDLSGVNLFKAKLFNCSFTKSEMDGVNFDSAQLIQCNFKGVDLSNANIDRASSLEGCAFDQLTKLPFSKATALAKGMVYKPSHLTVVGGENAPRELAEVIQISSRQNRKKVPAPDQPGQVINLVDYFKPKSTGDDGPRIA